MEKNLLFGMKNGDKTIDGESVGCKRKPRCLENEEGGRTIGWEIERVKGRIVGWRVERAVSKEEGILRSNGRGFEIFLIVLSFKKSKF